MPCHVLACLHAFVHCPAEVTYFPISSALFLKNKHPGPPWMSPLTLGWIPEYAETHAACPARELPTRQPSALRFLAAHAPSSDGMNVEWALLTVPA